jgi:hypothetical protein
MAGMVQKQRALEWILQISDGSVEDFFKPFICFFHTFGFVASPP